MKSLAIVILLNITFSVFAQEEGYAVVSSINNNVLMLNNCTDTNGSFQVNQKVIIIQKESGSIVMNTNAVSNKNIAQKLVARKFVVLTITEVDRSESGVTSIKVSRDLQNSFIINNMAAVDVSIVTCRVNW